MVKFGIMYAYSQAFYRKEHPPMKRIIPDSERKRRRDIATRKCRDKLLSVGAILISDGVTAKTKAEKI